MFNIESGCYLPVSDVRIICQDCSKMSIMEAKSSMNQMCITVISQGTTLFCLAFGHK